MRLCPLLLCAAAIAATAPGAVRAAESHDNCTGFIDALPATVSTQGVWCLRSDLATNLESGIRANDPTSLAVIEGNVVSGLLTPQNASYGVTCTDLDIVLRDNTIHGFDNGTTCNDAGGNVIH